MHVCRYNSRFQAYSISLCVMQINVDVIWPYMWSIQFLFHLTPNTECIQCLECKQIKSECTVIWSLTVLWKMCVPFLALDTSSSCLQSFYFYCSGCLIARDGHSWRRMLVRIQFLVVISIILFRHVCTRPLLARIAWRLESQEMLKCVCMYCVL